LLELGFGSMEPMYIYLLGGGVNGFCLISVEERVLRLALNLKVYSKIVRLLDCGCDVNE